MTTVRELHQEAMLHAQEAMVARRRGDVRLAQELAQQAYDLETKAIALVPEDRSSEPTLSILHRSAASLAYQFKDYEAAQRQIANGLSGYPPPAIAGELKDLLRMIDFELDLQSRGVLLQDEDLDVSLEGKSVGPGIIPLSEVTDRLEFLRSLIERTVSRMLSRPYRKGGGPPSDVRPWIPLLCAPKAGSLVLSIKLGKPDQQQLPMWLEASDVIDQLVKGVELIEQANEQALREMIAHDSYYLNFVTLTSAIAPDGERISIVGFASRSRAATLKRPKAEIREAMLKPVEETTETRLKRVEVRGELDYADSRKAKDLIGLTTEGGEQYTIVISEGIDDLVRTYYGREVVVTGAYDQSRRRVTPDHIEPVGD